MSTSMLSMILVIVFFGGVISLGAYGVHAARQRLRQVSRALFDTEDIVAGLNKVKEEASETPKSVTGMTRLMEPQIQSDFPEFSWNSFKQKAETMLLSSLAAIAKGDVSGVKEASLEARNQIQAIIESNEASDVKVFYDNPHIHQTEIANYKKNQDACTITIQTAIEYVYYKTKGGRVMEGSRERKTQTKYNLELLYLRNPDLNEFDNAVGVTCPNCGAPITSLGHMVCSYCGSEVTPLNDKIWSLHHFYEVKKQSL